MTAKNLSKESSTFGEIRKKFLMLATKLGKHLDFSEVHKPYAFREMGTADGYKEYWQRNTGKLRYPIKTI